MTNILSNIGANTASKFNSLVNSAKSVDTNPLRLLGLSNTVGYYYAPVNIEGNSVTALYSNHGTGVSHAADLKQRMSDIEWSRGYSWDVHITPPPRHRYFGQPGFGLPVVEVQSDFALIGESGDLNMSNSTYHLPMRKNFFDIKLTLLDDEEGTMEHYFADWQAQIYGWDGTSGLNGTINYLANSVRQINITKLNSNKRELFTRMYLVYPEAAMSTFNDSTGNVRNFTINLVVAGFIGTTQAPSIVDNYTPTEALVSAIEGANKQPILTQAISRELGGMPTFGSSIMDVSTPKSTSSIMEKFNSSGVIMDVSTPNNSIQNSVEKFVSSGSTYNVRTSIFED